MAYTAGSLSVDILGTATGAVKEIKTVISYLDKLQKALSVFSSMDGVEIGQKLAETFKNIGASLKSITDEDIARLGELGNATSKLKNFVGVLTKMDTKTVYTHMNSLMRVISSTVGLISEDTLNKVSQLGTALANLSTSMRVFSKTNFGSFKVKDFDKIGIVIGNISRFEKQIKKINFDEVGKAFDLLAQKIKPFIDEVNRGETSLNALLGVLNKITKSSGGGKKGKGGGGGAFSFLNLAKWTGIFYMGRRIARVVQGIAQQGADYTETLNLWETAMSGNLGVATEFVNKMNEAYGISEKTLMNAQAIFKNMLGSLGQISETMAYQLSEGITQMALDYASLYNVTFEKAFEKFQAALAGQVRPIRSVSGYDITENTLYQLYQTLGGEKSVRNLSRTEKQLLSILAIFRQMNASGAVGDLKKTMESYANQSRVLKESWQDVKSYAGLIFVDLLEDYNVLVNINAVMIFIGDTLKAVAESMGAIKSYGGDIFGATTDSAMEAVEATDELNGKLLDFDKFRALSGSGDEQVGLDEKLLQALSSYDTILGDASMAARDLAEQFKISSGLFDENGVFQPERWEEIEKGIKGVAIAIGTFSAALAVVNIVKWLVSPVGLATAAISVLVLSIMKLVTAWDEMSNISRAITILTAVTAAAVGLFMAFKALSLSVPAAIAGGIALASGMAAIGMMIGNIYNSKNIPSYETGASNIDSGTVFRAGENGKTEAVYTAANGKTNVANVQQMKSAFYEALVEYGSTQGKDGQPIVVYLDGEKVYQNTTAHAKRRGEVWSKA